MARIALLAIPISQSLHSLSTTNVVAPPLSRTLTSTYVHIEYAPTSYEKQVQERARKELL